MAERVSENEKRNQRIFQKMSLCERETGKTAEQLIAEQQSLRAAFYQRTSAVA